MLPNFNLRPAVSQDYPLISEFIHSQEYVHRHLDWRDTLDWLGHEPFYVLEKDRQVVAVFGCPPEPPEIAWVRLFSASSRVDANQAWQCCFKPALELLKACSPRPQIASLALADWFENVLRANGFEHFQDIVVLKYDGPTPALPHLGSDLVIRPMQFQDLPVVAQVDHEAFQPLWRMSLKDLERAFESSGYATVAVLDDQIIGYQTCSGGGISAHLSRLAVRSDLQRRHIGAALVQDLLHYFLELEHVWQVTVNTQNDNHSSLALYQRIGFRFTGERFPVFVYPTSS